MHYANTVHVLQAQANALNDPNDFFLLKFAITLVLLHTPPRQRKKQQVTFASNNHVLQVQNMRMPGYSIEGSDLQNRVPW